MLDEKKLKTSRWVFIYGPKDGVFLIFHSKNLKIFITDKDIFEVLKYLKEPRYLKEVFSVFRQKIKLEKSIRTLIKNGFLVESSENEIKKLKSWITKTDEKRRRTFGLESRLNALRVVLTEKCNLNCTYCFVKNNPSNELQRISIQNLLKGIDFLASLNKNKAIELQFFGGEPLLEFELIKKAVIYTNKLKKNKEIKEVFFGITVNGTLVTKEHSKFFKENDFLVSVSLDGSASIHNSNRHYYHDKGSFKDVMRGINILKKDHNELGILVTPSRNNIKKLAASCEYIIKKLGCKFITINTPQPTKGNWEINGKLFSREIKKCIEVAKKNKAIINHFGTRVFYGLDKHKPLVLSCSKFGNHYTATLTPDGKIGPCIVSWHHKECLTPLNAFELKKIVNWKLYKPLFFNKCFTCPAMNICGGPCPLEIYEMEKLSKPIDHERCNFFNDFLEWAIWYKG